MWQARGDQYVTVDGKWNLEYQPGDGFVLRGDDSCIVIFLHSEDLINAIAEATVKIMRERKAL